LITRTLYMVNDWKTDEDSKFSKMILLYKQGLITKSEVNYITIKMLTGISGEWV
jgi:hypothetical protein